MGRLMRTVIRRWARFRSTPSSPSTPTPPACNPMEELERIFMKFDTNGDGKISSSELAAIFRGLSHPATDEEISGMMSEADVDGDGFISLDEFVELNTRRVDPGAVMEDLRHAFSVFDLDHNGSISADELLAVLGSLGEEVSLSQCKKMIDGVDRDGDGLVSFEEFKDMMSGSPFTSTSGNT